jgi:hypothetical protein
METNETPVQKMLDFAEPASTEATLQRIRIETVLSRFPIHTLSKTGKVDICITQKGEKGEHKVYWKVTPNSAYGEPRALAYKLDTLVINRRFDELGRPLPELVKLGSLRDIAKELGLGGNTNDVKKALRQNAHTVITAKLSYTDKESRKQYAEFETTRYGVVFTGEVLPSGKRADSVYITLNTAYRAILNSASVRPLDYTYLKHLPPSAQRFYEVISYRVFAALNAKQPEARLRYSEYCTYSGQKRSFNWNNVRPQMSEVHKPHLLSGYLKSVRFEDRTDTEGNPDWLMSYVPGPKAKAEHSAFAKKERALAAHAQAWPGAGKTEALLLPALKSERDLDPVISEMRSRGISERKAHELLANKQPGQHILDQLEWGDEVLRKARPGTFHNPPGLIISMIEGNLTPPPHFECSRMRSLREKAEREKVEQQSKRAQLELQYEQYCGQEAERYLEEELPADEYKSLFSEKKKEFSENYKNLQLNPSTLTEMAHAAVRSEVARRLPLQSFEQFCTEHLR